MLAKIRATVTEPDLDYVGSITIDSDLMAAADASRVGYASDLTDEQWKLVERELGSPGKRLLAALHQEARKHAGRAELPSLLVIDTHLARRAAHGGPAFHDRGGPYGRTLGAKRVVAVDATGLPVAALVVPASTHENDANAALLAQLVALGMSDRLAVVMVDRGMTQKAARAVAQAHGVEVRVTGWPEKSSQFRPIAHAWRVEVAHGRFGRSRRLAKSFEKTVISASGWLQVACVAAVLDA